MSVGVCVSEEEEDDEGEKMRWFCRWRREREKKGAKLEIIKIMYRRATVIVQLCIYAQFYTH